MSISLKRFLRQIKIVKPCPVNHYRKEDLDFIFNLYNTDYFTKPFEPGDLLTAFTRDIKQLHYNLQHHRDANDEKNSKQANTVFFNLGAIIQLGELEVYDIKNWRCLAADALRFNCSEAINDLLNEYHYDDYIHNHHLYTDTALLKTTSVNLERFNDWLPSRINDVKNFLSAQKLAPIIADDYFNMINRHSSL